MRSLGAMLATKLIPPTKRGALFEHPQLATRIEALAEQNLVLACAPAGYGNTSLLAPEQVSASLSHEDPSARFGVPSLL